ncbi:MAG TPA: hypothetical protein VMI15_01775 [Burkholderiales bacterium]|nr:hypothetical protein [Burkholderiales bacterium]
MLATLTLPLCPDLPAPRTPTVRVRSADDLRGALRQARGSGLTVDASGMDRVLCFDAGRGLVEVQAATTWATLAAFLSTHDIDIGAFARDAALPTAIGECLALAAPGPDGQPATAHVAAITLATPDGELRRADRSVNAELFRLALGGQGVIGVLYSATLCLRSVQAGAAAAAPPVELGFGEAAGGSASGIECLLPPERLEAYLAAARALAEERRVRLHRIAVRRYLPESECHLRWARRDWAGVEVRFGVKPTLGAGVAAAEVRRGLLAAALAQGGSFPVRDLRDATRGQLEACYPAVAGFLAEKRRVDPAERLQNAWYRRLRAILKSEPCDSRWCAG